MSDGKLDQHARRLALEIIKTKRKQYPDLGSYDLGLWIDDGLGNKQRVRILVSFLDRKSELES